MQQVGNWIWSPTERLIRCVMGGTFCHSQLMPSPMGRASIQTEWCGAMESSCRQTSRGIRGLLCRRRYWDDRNSSVLFDKLTDRRSSGEAVTLGHCLSCALTDRSHYRAEHQPISAIKLGGILLRKCRIGTLPHMPLDTSCPTEESRRCYYSSGGWSG